MESRSLLAATLGISALLEGPAGGTDSSLIVTTDAWSVTADVPWLHSTSSGTGDGLVTFTFDENTGATRTGTLTIADQTLTVTQAGNSYVAAGPVTLFFSEETWPNRIAIGGSGNVYFVDTWHRTIHKWNISTGLTTLVDSGLDLPWGIAVDQSGNVYIADTFDDAIKQWNASTGLTTLVSSWLNLPDDVAVDDSGNVYIADTYNNAVKRWNASTGLTALVSSGLNGPLGIAVDDSGNVYIADTGNGAVKRWNASTGLVTTLIDSGSCDPVSVAVDGSGNVYIVDYDSNTIQQWNAATGLVTILVDSGLSMPYGVAVDGSGNVYIADYGHKAIKELPRAFVPGDTIQVSAAAGADQTLPLLLNGQSLDGALAPTSDQSWLTIDSVTDGVIVFSFAGNTSTSSRTAHLTVLGQQITVTQAGVVAPTMNNPTVTDVTASGATLGGNVVDDGGVDLTKRGVLYALTSVNPNPTLGGTGVVEVDDPSVTIGVFALPITGLAPGATYSFVAFATNSAGASYTTVSTFTTPAALGTGFMVEGPSAGADTIIVLDAGAWSVTTDVSWLHSTSSGTGNGLATFTFDANTGPTRTGTLTIAGQTLTVTQAGSGYVAAGPVTLVSSGLSYPYGVAVDGSGNVYIADSYNHVIKQWNASTGLTTLVSAGLSCPGAIAVDGSGNLYIVDENVVKKWSVSTGETTLIVYALFSPYDVAVDDSGNVYIADFDRRTIEMWNASTGRTTLISSGLGHPRGVAVDGAGNVYIADYGYNAILKWNAATGLTTLVNSGLISPIDVAVDGAGNLYIADGYSHTIKKWNAATGLTTLVPALSSSFAVAVDGSGNVYIADASQRAIQELPRAFVPGDAIQVSNAAGTDQTPPILLTGQSLDGVFVPSSDQSWLTIDSITDGVIRFSFAQNTGALRTAHIRVLGQSITVNQAGLPTVVSPTAGSAAATTAILGGNVTSDGGGSLTRRGVLYALTSVNPNPRLEGAGVVEVDAPSATTGVFTLPIAGLAPEATYSFVAFATNSVGTSYTTVSTFVAHPALGATNLVEGPSAGTDSVILLDAGDWSVTSNVSWLHSTSSGTGNGLVTFTFDANAGPTRTGTLTIADQTLTVIQAGSDYVAAGTVTLVSSGLSYPSGMVADGSGNLYIIDYGHNAIKKWNVATGLTTLIDSGLTSPSSIAVDGSGNLYIADDDYDTIMRWNASTGLTTLIDSGLNGPLGIAVDGSGNVYIANFYSCTIQKWNASTGLTTLVSTVPDHPTALAVDGLGNVYIGVYIADALDNVLMRWNASTGLTTLASGMDFIASVTVDGSGNVYIADANNDAIKRWNVTTGLVTTLVDFGVFSPWGVAVDGSGNVYIADTNNDAIEELPRAFVPGDAIQVSAPAGTDQTLPVLLNGQSLDGVFTPTSDQSWLTIDSVTGGVLRFSFAQNTSTSSRTAHLTVLGQQIAVTQAGVVAPTVTSPTVTGVTTNGATLGGNVASDGGGITRRGVLYAMTSVNSNPTLGGTGVIEVDDPSVTTGVFTVPITGLTPGATYSFVAFAVNSAGASYTNPVASFTVALPATLSFVDPPTAVTYGSTVTFSATLRSDGAGVDGADVRFTITDSGNNVRWSGTATSVSGSVGVSADLRGIHTGDYTLTAAYAGDDTYWGDSVTTALRIDQAVLAVTASVADKVYDGSVGATVTAWTTNALSGDDVSVTCVGASFDDKDVGTGKQVVVSGLSLGGDDAGDYTLGGVTTINAIADITPAALTIAADNVTMVQGNALPTFTATYTGLVGGDTPSTFGTPPTLSTTATGHTVGRHTITVVGAASINYNITSQSGSLTVLPANNTADLVDGVLYVYGTQGNDVVLVNPGAVPHSVTVTINGVRKGTFQWSDCVVIHGLAGNDYLGVSGALPLTAWLYGDEGNDTLWGGGDGSLLAGGSGNDTLLGGVGRSLLVGGSEKDILLAGRADTLLVSGATAYDANTQALQTTLNTWSSTASYATRGAQITDTGAAYPLNVTTVIDDRAADVLFGGRGADIFFRGLRSIVVNRQEDEWWLPSSGQTDPQVGRLPG